MFRSSILALHAFLFHIMYSRIPRRFFLNGDRLKGTFTFQFYTKWCDGIPVVIVSASVNKVARDTVVYLYEWWVFWSKFKRCRVLVFFIFCCCKPCVAFPSIFFEPQFFLNVCFKFIIHLHKTNMVDFVFKDKQNSVRARPQPKTHLICTCAKLFSQLFQQKFSIPAFIPLSFFLSLFTECKRSQTYLNCAKTCENTEHLICVIN